MRLRNYPGWRSLEARSSEGSAHTHPRVVHISLVILYASGEYQFALPPRPGGQCA